MLTLSERMLAKRGNVNPDVWEKLVLQDTITRNEIKVKKKKLFNCIILNISNK